jgi:hypothetical protein
LAIFTLGHSVGLFLYKKFSQKILRRWRVYIVVIYSLAAFSFAMPSEDFPLKPIIAGLTSRVLVTLNLWQYWDMFAPTPRADDFKVEVVYLTGDGGRHSVFLTDMRSMGYFERWQKERWRKYFNDNLRTDAQRYLWEPFAVFFARELASGGITPVQIELIRHWRSADKPFGPHLKASIKSSPWNKYTFYVWRAEPQGDLGGRHGG